MFLLGSYRVKLKGRNQEIETGSFLLARKNEKIFIDVREYNMFHVVITKKANNTP